MKYKREFTLWIIVWLLLAFIAVGFVMVNQAHALPVANYECVDLTYHRYMVCEYPPGIYTNYTAGTQNIVLAGNVPHDARLDGRSARLTGYLVNNGCTMLFVEKLELCPADSPNK